MDEYVLIDTLEKAQVEEKDEPMVNEENNQNKENTQPIKLQDLRQMLLNSREELTQLMDLCLFINMKKNEARNYF